MSESKEQREIYTIGSAIVYRGNKIALRVTDKGLSLLGGFVDWAPGASEAVVHKIQERNGIEFAPMEINGITQNYSPSGKWITNINFVGPATRIHERRSGQEEIIWLTPEQALNRKKEFRTPDTSALIQRLFTGAPLELSFVNTTYAPSSAETAYAHADTETAAPEDLVVASNVIAHRSEERKLSYLLMICGRSSGKGKRSLLGGKLIRGERLGTGSLREAMEELGGALEMIHPLGLARAYVNKRSKGYITNFVTLGLANEKITEVPEAVRGETEGVEWVTIEEVVQMNENMFRTPDTPRAIAQADYMLRHRRGPIPFSFVETIEAA